MSTKFYHGVNSSPEISETGYHDTDFDYRFWDVVRSKDPVAENWTVYIRDYDGRILGALPTPEIAKALNTNSRKPEVTLDIATITTLAAMWSADPEDTGPEGGEYDIHVWLMLAAEYVATGQEKLIGTKEFNTEWFERTTA